MDKDEEYDDEEIGYKTISLRILEFYFDPSINVTGRDHELLYSYGFNFDYMTIGEEKYFTVKVICKLHGKDDVTKKSIVNLTTETCYSITQSISEEAKLFISFKLVSDAISNFQGVWAAKVDGNIHSKTIAPGVSVASLEPYLKTKIKNEWN